MPVILGYTCYELIWYFVLYSFIGWCVEVVFCTVTSGKVVNRGFLNGPVCPIYGFGMLAVLLLLRACGAADTAHVNVFVLFLGSMLLSTLVELVGGWLMLKLFHARWWDYSDKPFNLGGFICLEFSLAWGFGGVLVVRVIQPMLAHAAGFSIPTHIGWPILAVLYTVYLADFIVTLITVAGFNRDLKELDAVRKSLRRVSDSISGGLGTGALQTSRAVDESKLQAALAKAEARDALSDMKDAATDALSDAKDNAADALGDIKDAAADALSDMKDSAAETLAAARASAAAAGEKAQATRAQLEARSAALVQDILGKRHFGGGRLLASFPDMKHTDYRDIVEELEARIRRTAKPDQKKEAVKDDQQKTVSHD